MNDELIVMHAIFKGRVQGIGFRTKAKQEAILVGVKGSVRNLSDGSVELYAYGIRQHIMELIKALQDFQGIGNESLMILDEIFPTRPYAGFNIYD